MDGLFKTKIMKLLILTAFCLLTIASCKERSSSVARNTDYLKSKYPVYIDAKGNHYITFSEIPDSLLTPEGKVHSKVLKVVMENNVVVENNKLVMKLSKDEYLAKGMTENDYSDLQSNLNYYNHYYDSTRNDMVGAMIADMKRGYKPYQSGK